MLNNDKIGLNIFENVMNYYGWQTEALFFTKQD